MKIYNKLGPGLKESVYANAFEDILKKENIPYRREVNLPVFFEGKKVGDYRLDFLVYDKIIIELKSQPQIPRMQIQKVYQYLKSSSYKLGFIVNFGLPELQIIRRIFDKSRSVKSVVIRNNPRKGFALIEILLVLVILGLVLGMTIPIGINFLKTEQLDTAVDDVLHTLRRAQAMAMAQENDSNYGVHLEQDQYILFKGDPLEKEEDQFDTRDITFDQIYDLPGDVKASGLSEVVFLRRSGNPIQTGSIILSNDRGSNEILINSMGRISIKGRFFFTFASLEQLGICTNSFLNPSNALGPPDDIFAEGNWKDGNCRIFSGFDSENATGTIKRVEVLVNSYITETLSKDHARITVKTPLPEKSYDISKNNLNGHIGEDNKGDIAVDITSHKPSWIFDDLSQISFEPALIKEAGKPDAAIFYLDSIGLRVTFE